MGWTGIVYFICFGIVSVSLWWWIEKRRIQNHQSKLSKLRPNLSDDDFIKYFSDRGIRNDVTIWILNQIGSYKYVELKIHWDDELWDFYCIDGEELEDIFNLAFEAFAIPKPVRYKPLEIPTLHTVEDLIIYLNGQVQNLS